MIDLSTIVPDLEAEHRALDTVLAGVAGNGWDAGTPAVGWTIRDQIHHLWFFDGAAMRAITDPEGFVEDSQAMMVRGSGWERGDGPVRDGPALLAAWRDGGRALVRACQTLDPGRRLPWYGRDMGAISFVTARLMECWCHGQDVRDTLGVEPSTSPRLRHIADIGIRALPNAFRIHGHAVPADPIHVEVEAPGGGVWTWGDADAAGGSVRGTALDLCLVVTQRRHPADTALVADGAVATAWLEVAQAFAGPPGEGRRAGQFPRGLPGGVG